MLGRAAAKGPSRSCHSAPLWQSADVGRPCAHLCRSRLDVLIVREEVGRVIVVLECDQSLVVAPVGGSHPPLFLVAQEVNVDPTARKRLQRAPACACPPNVPICGAAFPCSYDARDIRLLPQRKGRLSRSNTAELAPFS